jgi:hypothetical protein
MDLVACRKESMQGASIHVTLICGNGKEISRTLTVISGFSLNFPRPDLLQCGSGVLGWSGDDWYFMFHFCVAGVVLVCLGWSVDTKYDCVLQ